MAQMGIASTGRHWPAELGVPAREGYQVTANAAFRSLEVEDGPPRWRKVRVSPVFDAELTFTFTPAQMAVFRAFWRDTLALGSLPFDMPLWFEDGRADKVAHVREQFSWTVVGIDYYRVSFPVRAFDLYVPAAPLPVIWAGTPAAPSTDDVWAGTPAAPHVDIIAAPAPGDI